MSNTDPIVARTVARSPLPLLLLAALQAPLLAQHEPAVAEVATADGPQLLERGARGQRPLLPLHTAAADQGHAYGLWGAGARYKASFHDGATVVPYLGRDYPHNQPWRWTTTSVTVGGNELVTQAPRLTGGDPVGGFVAAYDLGAVSERYELRDEGVEQTFVLRQRVGEGDLVVRGAVDTLLHCAAVAAAHQELRFVDDAGRHIVGYGAATAVDAAGRRRPMTTSFADGAITLRLDAAWLATASYPVVVDPLLGPGDYVYSVPDLGKSDIVRDNEGGAEQVWIGLTQYTSAQDSDLFGLRYEDDGSYAGYFFEDVTNSWSTDGPSVAYLASTNRTVLVFDRILPGGSRVLRTHTHLRTDTGWNTTYSQIATGNNAWRADVGGSSWNSAGPEVLIVYQQEANGGAFQESSSSSVYGVTFDTVAETASAPFLIASSALVDTESPSVNQWAAGLAPSSWLVAYQQVTTLVIGGTDDWDIGVREVSATGTVSAATYIDNASSDHKLSPRIEGQSGHYLVSFVASPNSGTIPSGQLGNDLRVARLEWPTGSGAGTQPHGTVQLVHYNDARIDNGGLGFDRYSRSHWVLTWRSSVTDSIYLREVGFTGQSLHSESVLVSPSLYSVIGGVCYDGITPQYVLSYASYAAGSSYVTMDRFVYPSVTPAFASGPACSQATIAWHGSQQIGSQGSWVEVTGAPVNSLHICVVAFAPAQLQLFGVGPIQDGCWLLVPPNGPDYAGMFGLQVGSLVSWSLPLPESVAATTLYFQDFHTVAGGGPFELISTQRLTVPIVK
ncbi:MAG: hypothetical protein H6835_12460 [Planctomycetes bacterium]|nr:hypothetical protein [Planctomycetota bacterium]